MDFQEWFQSWNWMHHPCPLVVQSPHIYLPLISSSLASILIFLQSESSPWFLLLRTPIDVSLASNILFIVVINILRSKSKFSSNLRPAETAPGTRQPRHLATWNLPENGCVHPLTIRIASTRYGDFTWESQVEAAILSKLWKVNTLHRFII